jgi:hypothetical protein
MQAKRHFWTDPLSVEVIAMFGMVSGPFPIQIEP